MFDFVMGKLTYFFIHPANKIYESLCFHRRTQQRGESVDTFFFELHHLVSKIDWCATESLACCMEKFQISSAIQLICWQMRYFSWLGNMKTPRKTKRLCWQRVLQKSRVLMPRGKNRHLRRVLQLNTIAMNKLAANAGASIILSGITWHVM